MTAKPLTIAKPVASPSSAVSPISPRIASLDPKFFSSDFDLVAELVGNRDEYRGDEAITVYGYPRHIAMSVDRVRARVNHSGETGKPGMNPTIACCVGYGVGVLSSNESVRAIIRYRERMELAEGVSALELAELSTWFQSFIEPVSDGLGGGLKRINVMLPVTIKSAVTALASELGASASVMIVLCLMVALADQPTTLAEHQEQLTRSLETFYLRADIRRDVAESLLARAKVGKK